MGYFWPEERVQCPGCGEVRYIGDMFQVKQWEHHLATCFKRCMEELRERQKRLLGDLGDCP